MPAILLLHETGIYICMYMRVKDHIEVIFPFCYLSLVNQNKKRYTIIRNKHIYLYVYTSKKLYT